MRDFVNIFLYAVLLLMPIPLIIGVVRHEHFKKYFFPFMALMGMYIYVILGSIVVIYDDALFNYTYYFTLLLLIVLFWVFYIFIFYIKDKLSLGWSCLERGNVHVHILFLIGLWSLSFGIFLLYFKRHGLPPVFGVNLEQFVGIYQLRGEKWTDLPEGTGWYVLGFMTIPAFTVVYTYILKYLNDESRLVKHLYYVNLILGLFVLSFTATKSPFFFLIVYLYIFGLLFKKNPLTLKRFAVFILIVGVTYLAIIRVYYYNRAFLELLPEVAPLFLERVFAVYSGAHAHVTNIFPMEHHYFYGATFSNPGHILPYEPINISQFLGYQVNRTLQNYSPPSFSEGYANFGLVGFVFIVMMMFVQILMLQFIFKLCPKNPLFLTLYIIVAEKMTHYAIEPIQMVITEEFVVFSVFIVLLFYFINAVFGGIGESKLGVDSFEQCPFKANLPQG